MAAILNLFLYGTVTQDEITMGHSRPTESFKASLRQFCNVFDGAHLKENLIITIKKQLKQKQRSECFKITKFDISTNSFIDEIKMYL